MNDVAQVVERFAELGLLFSATRHVDGSLKLYRFRHLQAYENEQAIEELWANCLPDASDKERLIAEFFEARRRGPFQS